MSILALIQCYNILRIMNQIQKFQTKLPVSSSIECVNYQTECRLMRENNINIIQPDNKAQHHIQKCCRVCLQSEANQKDVSKQGDPHSLYVSNPIISLPCACKDQLGMIHENCIKFWIKVWLESKILSHQAGTLQEHQQQRQNAVSSSGHQQRQTNQPPQREQPKIKSLNFKNLKQKTIYPFTCQICRHPIYFDLFFHYRLKRYSQLTKKDLILFALPFMFTVAFLGICVNWILQTGVNLYLILFYALVWIPLFIITVAIGVWTFTKQQFWVKGIYSRQQIRKRNRTTEEKDTKEGKQGKGWTEEQLKNDKNPQIHMKLEQIRDKFNQKSKKEVRNPQIKQQLDMKHEGVMREENQIIQQIELSQQIQNQNMPYQLPTKTQNYATYAAEK